MNYEIAILRRTQKELAELSTEVYERVQDSIGVAQEPRPPGCVKLTNREEWRI